MIQLIDRASICNLLPHSGDMCLLNEVIEVDEKKIICLSRTHLNKTNPLRVNGKLYAVAGVEYASQTIALHGHIETINSGKNPVIGFLVTIRNMQIDTEFLDSINDNLRIEAVQSMRIEGAVNYEFNISSNHNILLSGRMTTKLMNEVPDI